MQEEERIEKPGRQPKKKKKSHRLYALIVIILGFAIIALAILILFYVQKIEISGNEYCSDEEIADTVKNDKYSINTLYILGKYALGYGAELPCMESMNIRLKNPWTLKVTVKEKTIVGFVQDGDKYAYFDKEGMVVLKTTDFIKGLPSIQGISMKDMELYQTIKSGDSKIFEEILETSREAKRYDLSTDRIVCREDKIYLYIGKICINLGSSVSSEQIAQIGPIMEKLEGQEGTLHLENYTEGSKTITFDIGELPEEN